VPGQETKAHQSFPAGQWDDKKGGSRIRAHVKRKGQQQHKYVVKILSIQVCCKERKGRGAQVVLRHWSRRQSWLSRAQKEGLTKYMVDKHPRATGDTDGWRKRGGLRRERNNPRRRLKQGMAVATFRQSRFLPERIATKGSPWGISASTPSKVHSEERGQR